MLSHGCSGLRVMTESTSPQPQNRKDLSFCLTYKEGWESEPKFWSGDCCPSQSLQYVLIPPLKLQEPLSNGRGDSADSWGRVGNGRAPPHCTLSVCRHLTYPAYAGVSAFVHLRLRGLRKAQDGTDNKWKKEWRHTVDFTQSDSNTQFLVR